ncbi:MAG: biopolymer transporter ExbD [Candidatus Omnitrophota bacterium]|nr:biopolymer transporter ExbD [Candidatus Omnitrophota bacterium]
MKKRIKFTPPLLDQINITPMMDVALVLLVVFVIISPLIGPGIPVRLPTAAGEKLSVTATILLTLNKQGEVFLSGRQANPIFLLVDLQNLKKASPDLKVIIQADKEVSYEAVVSLLDIVRQAGISAVGLATTPASPDKQ